MNLASFLHLSQTEQLWEHHRKIIFTGSSYSAHFFALMFKHLEKKNKLPKPYQRLFIDNADKKALYATLQQSILGAYSFFWLGDVTEEKESKKMLESINFLLNYSGPHYIAFFISSASSITIKNQDSVVSLTQELSLEEIDALGLLFNVSLDEKKRALVKKIIYHNTNASLESYCLLIQYLELISTKQIDEHIPFLESLFGIEPTFAQLSDYFFAKNAGAFFTTWSKIGKNYPDIFWISFWSELLWKASHTITFLKKNDFIAVKRISYRLPPQFVKKYWQQTSHRELVTAFNFLYDIDYNIKTGSDFCAFDLFFMNYFTGSFAHGAWPS